MSTPITFQLSYFRPNEPSSVDILVNTQGNAAHGFQIVADITASPAISVVDENQDVDGLQLGIIAHPDLNFITNKVEKTDTGYRLVLAAITKNPKQPFTSDENLLVGQLVFSQDQSGTLTIEPVAGMSKIPLVSDKLLTADQGLSVSPTSVSVRGGAVAPTSAITPLPTPKAATSVELLDLSSQSAVNIQTQNVGEKINTLTGDVYVAPTLEQNQLQPDEVSALGGSKNISPTWLVAASLLLVLVAAISLKKLRSQ